MIIAIDTETYDIKEGKIIPVLDANKVKFIAITNEQEETITFTNPDEASKYIDALAYKLKKERKNLYIYAHNHAYDIVAYRKQKLLQMKIQIYRSKPLYAREDNISYLDTLALQKTKLEDIGQTLKIAKLKFPETEEGIKEYCTRDTIIIIRYLKELKQRLQQLKMKPRKLTTCGQIAIAAYIRHIKEQQQKNTELYSIMQQGQFHKPKNDEYIRKAYHGPRVEAFRKGEYENVTMIDINMAYKKVMTTMPTPKLDTEKHIQFQNPQAINKQWLKDQIGVIHCKIKSPPKLPAILPYKHENKLVFPVASTITGHWVIQEVNHAIKNGYQLIEAYSCITYEPTKTNIFKDFLDNIEQLEIDKPEYKIITKPIRNYLYGKFAQRNKYKETKLITPSELPEYEQQGWQLDTTLGDQYLIQKTQQQKPKNYYAPILSIFTAAHMRIYLHEQLQKIPYNDLLYCDTDSIMFKGRHIHKFEIGKKAGTFKIEHENVKVNILGEKRYKIDEKVKYSGIPKRMLPQTIKEGQDIKIERYMTLNNSIKQRNIDALGTMQERTIRVRKTKTKEVKIQ